MSTGFAYSQWSGDAKQNNAVCVGPGDKWSTAITADGSGGAILAWQDDRNGSLDIFAQKVDMSGRVRWTVGGVAVCPDTLHQGYPELASDGAGGAVLAWCDDRSGNCAVFAQKVNSSGESVWMTGGIPVCKARGGRTAPAIISDGFGGAIIVWHDNRNGNYDIYGQRIDASGKIAWGSGGTAVCAAGADQLYPVIMSDGAGGAIVAWDDTRNGNHDIFAQRVNSSGSVEWADDGVAVCTATGNQMNPAMVTDGSGGTIIVWHDKRGANYDIFAQRLNASGKVLWPADGIVVSDANGDQSSPRVTMDGTGGAIVAWYDKRNGDYDIYAQRISAAGVSQWLSGGIPVCKVAGDQMYPAIVSDGAGGAIVAWHDNRDSNFDIYAERVDASGASQWTKDGVVVCAASGDQSCPIIVADGAGGAIISWNDPRNIRGDIYAQRIDRQGNLLVTR
jgi:hypothetical protein